MDPLALQQLPKQLHRGMGVAPLLDQHVEHLALIVDSAPQPHAPAADLHHHLIQMPSGTGRIAAPTKIGCDQRAELDDPAADRLRLTSMPRSASSSSTSRMESVNR